MTEAQHVHFRRHRFPAEIIVYAVWLYYRFPLSFRDVEDLLAERGIGHQYALLGCPLFQDQRAWSKAEQAFLRPA